MAVREHDLELFVGDVVQIGEMKVTVIDIDGPEVSFRIDSGAAEGAELQVASASEPRPK
jgi:hypothetical protein